MIRAYREGRRVRVARIKRRISWYVSDVRISGYFPEKRGIRSPYRMIFALPGISLADMTAGTRQSDLK